MKLQKRTDFIFWYLFLIVAIIGCALIFNKFKEPVQFFKNTPTIIYNIENKRLVLIEATNEAQWERGLMYADRNIPVDGMIFKFPKRANRTFWNKNTYVDLDVFWLNGERIIGRAYLPSIARTKREVLVQSPGQVDQVIEVIRK